MPRARRARNAFLARPAPAGGGPAGRGRSIVTLSTAPALAPARPEPPAPPPRPGATLTAWDPEDPAFWSATGRRVARRNLAISVVALSVAFAVWMVWSVVAVMLPAAGFPFTPDQLFWLAALPGLSGATLRIFYAFLVPVVGGRRFTALSTASLLLPAVGLGLAVQDPTTSYATFVALALLGGLGGANFASSMANVSFFFPRAEKGTALGLNAGLGNLGVSVVQWVTPLVVGVGLLGPVAGAPAALPGGGALWLQNAALVWVPPVVIAAALAWWGMNDLATARASFREQAVVFRRPDTWLTGALYLGTFGSFIGYSAGLALLTQQAFPGVDPTRLAFLGPLVGALARPPGGWLADRLGGARVTLASFGVMTAAALAVLASLPGEGDAGSFPGFLGAFGLLFAAAGVGNGSVYRMIPAIFSAWHERRAGAGEAAARARREAGKEAAAALGFVSALAAYGAFLVPRAFGASVRLTGTAAAALGVFVAYYAGCLALTWWRYGRRGAPARC